MDACQFIVFLDKISQYLNILDSHLVLILFSLNLNFPLDSTYHVPLIIIIIIIILPEAGYIVGKSIKNERKTLIDFLFIQCEYQQQVSLCMTKSRMLQKTSHVGWQY